MEITPTPNINVPGLPTNGAVGNALAATTVSVAPESWLKKHERIVITFLLLTAGAYGYHDYIGYRVKADSLKAQQAQALLVAQQNADKELAAQSAQSTAQYQSLVASLERQNSELAAKVSSRDSGLAVQQKADAALPIPSLVIRWSEIAGFNANHLLATADGITADQTAALTTVQTLEEVPVLEQNVKDVQTEANNSKAELGSANTVIKSQAQQIAGLGLELSDNKAACAAQEAATNANAQAQIDKAKKGKVKAYLHGFVMGFVSGTATAVAVFFH